MQNINPTQSRNRRALFYLMVLGFPLVLIGMTLLASVVLFSQFPAFGSATPIFMVLFASFGLASGVGGGIGVYRGLTLAHDNELALQVGEALKPLFGEQYVYLRNISRRRLGYIDAVLIGPPGALVFRVLNPTGFWRNEVAEWFTQDRNGRQKPAPLNPTRECARDVYALRNYFAKRQLGQIPVFGIVVFHQPNGLTLQASAPTIPISETHRLPEILKREYLAHENRIAPQIVEQAVRLLRDG